MAVSSIVNFFISRHLQKVGIETDFLFNKPSLLITQSFSYKIILVTNELSNSNIFEIGSSSVLYIVNLTQTTDPLMK